MNRSLYPEGTEVHQRHLEYTESSKAAEIKSVISDSTSLGVASGLTVTVNTPNTTRINIATGHGYTSTGEDVTLSVTQTNIALADYTLNTRNYVTLMYDETQSQPESHETDGTTRNTRAVASPRVVVLSETAYNALPVSNAVLSQNAKDRALILAFVTANGPGVALTTGSITLPTTFNTVLQITAPVAITGVSVVHLDPLTAVGTGSLVFVASSKEIKWRAPGDGAYGSLVTISASQEYTLSSSNTRTITISAQFPQLPLTDQTDSLAVSNLYSQTVVHLTNQDQHHRSMIGSGIPTIKNPHGLTVADLDAGTAGSVEQHQDEMHANGISPDASTNLLSMSVVTSATPDRLDVVDFSTGDAIYINGRRIQSMISAPSVLFADGIAQPSLYGVYLTAAGALAKQVRCAFPTTGTSLLYQKIQIISASDAIGSTTKNLTWTTAGTIKFDSGPAKAAPAADRVMRLLAADRVQWIDVLVKGGMAAPISEETDAIVFTVLPDAEEYFPLSYVVWSGSATGFLGSGWGGSNAPNHLIDRRARGYMTETQLRTDFGYLNQQQVIGELFGDGVYLASDRESSIVANSALEFAFTIVSGLSVKIEGGIAYVGGKRFNIPQTPLTLTASATNQIYIDASGTVLSSPLSLSAIQDAALGKPVLRIREAITDPANVTSNTDYRFFINARRDQPHGVARLDGNKTLVILSDAGLGAAITSGGPDSIALSVKGAGTGQGIYSEGGNTSGIGVHGVGGLANGAGVIGQANGSGTGVVALASGQSLVPSFSSAFSAKAGLGIAGQFQNSGTTTIPTVAASNLVGGPSAVFDGGNTYNTSVLSVINTAPTATQATLAVTGGACLYGVAVSIAAPSSAAAAIVGSIISGNGIAVQGLGANNGYGGSFSNSGAGYALEVGGGHARFTGSNPAIATGYTNTLTPRNIVKAWGKTVGNSLVIQDGFNVSTTTVASGATLLINLTNAVTGDYAVLVSHGSNTFMTVSAAKISNTQLQIYAFVGVGSPITLSAYTGALYFLVLGSQ